MKGLDGDGGRQVPCRRLGLGLEPAPEVGRARGEEELVQVEFPVAGHQSDVRGLRQSSRQEAGDVRRPIDVRVRRLGEVILKQEVSYSVIKGVVYAALALEGVPLGQGSYNKGQKEAHEM